MSHWYCLLPLLSKLLYSHKSAGRTNKQCRLQCNHVRTYNLLPSPSCLFIVSSLSLEEWRCFCLWSNEVRSEAMKNYVSSHQPNPDAPLQTRARAPTWLKAAHMDWWACPWPARLIELSSHWQDGEVWREWWGPDQTDEGNSHIKDAEQTAHVEIVVAVWPWVTAQEQPVCWRRA